MGVENENEARSESEHDFDQNKEVDEINLMFAEARDDIGMALESKETVYFNEDAKCARASVKEVLKMFDALLAKLNEKERAALQRSTGLKFELYVDKKFSCGEMSSLLLSERKELLIRDEPMQA
ncbi:hypothetical protein RJ641_029611 [Dillenia turbinata]|uniref:Uncharacterized protein n=1 Tax=Dillenia turbinata TaxID=194707 RepID=A0AAN8ZN68_9MAGN